MLRVAPKVAERTGTAVRPRPGCSAIWIPVAAAGERQARDSAEVNAEDRARPGPGPSLLTVAAVRAAVHAGTAEASIVRRATKTAPRTSGKASTANPGSGSAILAKPTGASGESRTATGTTTQAAATPMAPARKMPSETNWAREKPSAHRAGRSAESR
jgi:hypothetical protein